MKNALFLVAVSLFLSACAAKAPEAPAPLAAPPEAKAPVRVGMEWIEPDPHSPVVLIADHRFSLTRKPAPVPVAEKPAIQEVAAATVEKKPVPRSATTVKIVPMDEPILGVEHLGLKSEGAQGDESVVANDAPDFLGRLPMSILFDLDKAEIRAAERARLNTIPLGISVRVEGHACDLGDDNHNLTLSTKRANKVAEYLRQRGIVVSKEEGKGECCPVSEKREENRRVDIAPTP